ncbi:hypothetical protein SCA6_001818 [Theobroma cacao]
MQGRDKVGCSIPWLAQRLPAVLLPALKHKSILSPCLQILLFKEQEKKGVVEVAVAWEGNGGRGVGGFRDG